MKQMIVIGEVFWDEYNDGSVHLGGSELNVAWHLKGLGADPFVVSRVGQDPLGEKMLNAVKQWGLSIDYFQTDFEHPTGVIKIILDSNKKPTFITPESAAIDFIEFDQRLGNAGSNLFMHHGSMVLRNDVCRSTVKKLKDQGVSVFMDLNLRDPFWTPTILEEWVRDLEILKLSDDEFVHLSNQKNLPFDSQLKWLEVFAKERKIQNVLFTLGSKGSYWIQQGKIFRSDATIVNVVDTVGAGDAFCSGILFSMSQKLTPQLALEKSSQFASRICTVNGATSHDKEFYNRCRKEIWSI